MSDAHKGEHHDPTPDDAHGAKPAKGIGITIALLGVMLAVCAALVGSQRTALIETMVEQADHFGGYQSEAMKFRVMHSDLEILHALTPSKAEVDKFEHALKDVRGKTGKADDEDTAELKDAIDVSTRELADILSPDKEDEDRFAFIERRYHQDMAEAKEDTEAYDSAIGAHQAAAEHYEKAQLCAEIGIVVGSIALLLGSRVAWAIAIVVGLGGAGLASKTYLDTSHAMQLAEKRIEDAAKNTAKIEADD